MVYIDKIPNSWFLKGHLTSYSTKTTVLYCNILTGFYYFNQTFPSTPYINTNIFYSSARCLTKALASLALAADTEVVEPEDLLPDRAGVDSFALEVVPALVPEGAAAVLRALGLAALLCC